MKPATSRGSMLFTITMLSLFTALARGGSIHQEDPTQTKATRSSFRIGRMRASSSSNANAKASSSSSSSSAADAPYSVGVGIADATGPSVEVNFMGYAMMGQTGAGIHQRLRARAFIVADNANDKKRFAFVSLDGGMASQLMKIKVVEKLAQKYGPNSPYTTENVCISGTHSHSGPAGFLQYTLFQVTSLGFVQQAFDAFVDGIVSAIIKADENLQPGNIAHNADFLHDSNINRSPTAYLANPAAERAKYAAQGLNDTDLEMTLLKFMNADGNGVGMLNWFAVHGTSMNNTNRLVSGDNKGYASYLFEKAMNPMGTLPGKGKFVGAFAATNLGDISPNTNGTYCMDTGLPCDRIHSTCNGKNEQCVGRGPGSDMFESTKIIGANQFTKAHELYDNASSLLSGPVDFRHAYIDMSALTVTLANGENASTCSPSMGYAFAAGTTDGPGMFNFVQATNTTNPFWNAISGFLSKPTKEEIACQAPKPILLNTGGITEPYAWDPHIIPVQILRAGQLFILGAPSEFTTMAGRRLREAIREQLVADKVVARAEDAVVVIAGLSNAYASYTTTFEEYQVQRYEGASTVFGPHEHQGFVQELLRLSKDMAAGRATPAGPSPPDLSKHQISLLPGVVVDGVPIGKHFGDVTADVQTANAYTRGVDTVSCTFRAANPRNDLRTEDTYLAVQRQNSDKTWETVAVDGDWETKFHWARHAKLTDRSYATVEWKVPASAVPGSYRIQHYGNHKNILQKIEAYTGTSSTFTVA
jgi:neutral ceramidase